MRYLIILFLYLICVGPVKSSEIVKFGLAQSDIGMKRPGLPIYVTEGVLPNQCYIPKKNQLEDGVYGSGHFVGVNHPDKVTNVILQIDPSAKVGGASEANINKDAIFNYSYGTVFAHSSDNSSGYNREEQNLVNRTGYKAIPSLKATSRPTQIYIKAALNDFMVGVHPDTYDPLKYKGESYIKYIDDLIDKFGTMCIFCSQMDETGGDLRSTSSRPLKDEHSSYYICCPTPIFEQGNLGFLQGTSFSAPMGSALVSCLHRDFPILSLQDIRNIILVSGLKSYIRWSPQNSSFIKVDLTPRRFGNGLLSRENAYTLAQLASQSKISNVDFQWDELKRLYEEMPKQLLIFPSFDVTRNITAYVQWFNLTLLLNKNSEDQEGKNLYTLFQSLKFRNYLYLDTFTHSINNLLRELRELNRNADEIYTTLSSLFRNKNMIINTQLRSFYELQERIVQKYLLPFHQTIAINQVVFSASNLGSPHLPDFMKVLLSNLSLFEDDYQFVDAEEYLTYYEECWGNYLNSLENSNKRKLYIRSKPSKKLRESEVEQTK